MTIQFQSANHAPFLGKCLNLALSPSFGHLAPGELINVVEAALPPTTTTTWTGGKAEKRRRNRAPAGAGEDGGGVA